MGADSLPAGSSPFPEHPASAHDATSATPAIPMREVCPIADHEIICILRDSPVLRLFEAAVLDAAWCA
jgi:hypothetical protein